MTAVPYTGDLPTDYEEFRDLLVTVTVQPPDSSVRQFLGDEYDRTWENEHRPCYYCGSSQGGASNVVSDPDDSVIEGNFKEYRTASINSTAFTHSQFDLARCEP